MSGLCGWLSRDSVGCTAEENADLLARMAMPLLRFDANERHSAVGRNSAVTVAGHAGSTNLYQKDGLLIALWGRCLLNENTTQSAAEVASAASLAPLWSSMSTQVCAALSGQFALCILDEVGGEAFLAIDRAGIHPLSYHCTEHGLYFSSSADALTAHPALNFELNPQSIYNYLYFHTLPSGGGMYRGQQRLSPGEYMHYRDGKATEGRYWKMVFHEREVIPFRELKDEFLEILRHSVANSAGNAEVGAFLSGGTDSSTLVGVLGQVSGRPVRTYSIGFDVPGYDEMAYARIASRHFNSIHHEFYVTPDDVIDAIPKIAAIFDQPFGNASAVPTYFCAKMAQADGVSRLLGGDGGDELFGGNERYARQAQFSRYERIPSMLRQLVIEPFLFKFVSGVDYAILKKARSYITQALVPMPERLETYNLLRCYGHLYVLEVDFVASIDPGAPIDDLSEVYWSNQNHSQINQMMALDMQFTLAGNDLPKVVKACELAGVEALFPFLNDAMVEFSSRLAPYQKLNGTQLRYFFKNALRDVLPLAIRRKKKHGFGLPFGLWLQRHIGLRQFAFDSLSDLKARHIVRAEFIDDLQKRHFPEHPSYHGTMVWVLMMLEQWFCKRQG
jgi:asparagine synthase (glutamine-hydrolysing)